MPPSTPAAPLPPPTTDLATTPTSPAGRVVRSVPELAEAVFLASVFPDGGVASEAEMDDALMAKATALGITTTSHLPPIELPDESTGADTPEHARTESCGTAATTAPSSAPPHSRGTNGDVNPFSNGATPAATTGTAQLRPRSRHLSFSQYDKYLGQVDPNLKQPKFVKELPKPSADATPSLFSIGTRRSIINIKRTIQSKVRWKRSSSATLPISCICCRDDFSRLQSLQTLPCGHTYCSECLKIMINQSSQDESKMPPRCCTQPIPSGIVKAVLDKEEQQVFLKAVLQFSTPWEARLFCTNSACGEFIRPRTKIDPKHPFDVVCRRCGSRVCVMCKRDAHPLGQDCPADFDLDAVLRMGEKSGWRRCYKCRTLVELSQGCTHITCRCKAQFCYICGAVWDSFVGCPNYCNGEEELERRRLEEEARIAELEAEKKAREQEAVAAEAERARAAERTGLSIEFAELKWALSTEMERMVTYEQETNSAVRARHSQERVALLDRFSDQVEKMQERHAKTTQHLEDRQIAAEMDLRTTLDQRARSVKIRLRHMEAYCDGLGRSISPPIPSPSSAEGSRPAPSPSSVEGSRPASRMGMPARVVTERDLRELGQQYNMRDDLERLHQARINVLRDQQAKNMEELQERQGLEMAKLLSRRDEEIEDLEAVFTAEDDGLVRIYGERRSRARRRWVIRIEVLQKEMEQKTGGLKFGPIPIPEWPTSSLGDTPDAADEVATEEVYSGALDSKSTTLVGCADHDEAKLGVHLEAAPSVMVA